MKKLLIILMITFVAFTSCNKEDDDIDTNIKKLTSAVYSMQTSRETSFIFRIKGDNYHAHTPYQTNFKTELNLQDYAHFDKLTVSDVVNCQVSYTWDQPDAPDNEIKYIRLVINDVEHYEWDKTQNKFIKQ